MAFSKNRFNAAIITEEQSKYMSKYVIQFQELCLNFDDKSKLLKEADLLIEDFAEHYHYKMNPSFLIIITKVEQIFRAIENPHQNDKNYLLNIYWNYVKTFPDKERLDIFFFIKSRGYLNDHVPFWGKWIMFFFEKRSYAVIAYILNEARTSFPGYENVSFFNNCEAYLNSRLRFAI